jgi:hypothetical protein
MRSQLNKTTRTERLSASPPLRTLDLESPSSVRPSLSTFVHPGRWLGFFDVPDYHKTEGDD